MSSVNDSPQNRSRQNAQAIRGRLSQEKANLQNFVIQPSGMNGSKKLDILSNTLKIKRIAMTKQRYPIEQEKQTLIDHIQIRQPIDVDLNNAKISESSLSKSITKMQMYQELSRGKLHNDTISGHAIQIEVQNHNMDNNTDEQKPKVSLQQGTGLLLVTGGHQSKSPDKRITFNSGLSKFHGNDSDEHSSKRVDSQIYDIEKAHEDLKNLDMGSIQMKHSIDSTQTKQTPSSLSPLRSQLREYQVLRPNNLPFQPKKKEFVNRAPKIGPLNKFIPLQKLKQSPRVGTVSKQTPRNNYYMSRKQIGKSLALNNQPEKSFYAQNVIDLQKISDNSPVSNHDNSPKIHDNSRIKFSFDIDQINIIKPEIAIEDNNISLTDREREIKRYHVSQESYNNRISPAISTQRSQFATQNNSPNKDNRASPFQTKNTKLFQKVQVSGSIEIQQAMKKMSRIKIGEQILSGVSIQKQEDSMIMDSTMLEPKIQNSLQQSFISRQESYDATLQQSTIYKSPNRNQEPSPRTSQKEIENRKEDESRIETKVYVDEASKKVLQAQSNPVQMPPAGLASQNPQITMTTIAANSNECTTPAEDVTSPKEPPNLKKYEVIPENILKIVNSEQMQRVNHQKFASGFGVISQKEKDKFFTNAASSLLSSQNMLVKSATSENNQSDSKDIELNTIDEFDQGNLDMSNSTFLRISEDFSTHHMPGFQFQTQTNFKRKNKQLKMAVFNDAIKDVKIHNKKETSQENKLNEQFVSFGVQKQSQKQDSKPGYHVHKRVSTSFNTKRFFNARQKKQGPIVQTSMDFGQQGILALAPLNGSVFSGNKTCLNQIPKIPLSPKQNTVMESRVAEVQSKREAATAGPSAREYQSPRNISYGAGFQRQAKTGLGWMNKPKIKTKPRQTNTGNGNSPDVSNSQDTRKREKGQHLDFINSMDAPTFCPNSQLLDKQVEMIRKNMQTFEQAQSGLPPMLSPVMKGRTYIVKEFTVKNNPQIPKLNLSSQKNEPQIAIRKSPVIDKLNSKRVSFSMNANDDIKMHLEEQTSTTNNEFSHPHYRLRNSKYINEVVQEDKKLETSKSRNMSRIQSPAETEIKGDVSKSKVSMGSQANISEGAKEIQSSVSQEHPNQNSINADLQFTVNQSSIVETQRIEDGQGQSNMYTIDKAERTIGKDTIDIEDGGSKSEDNSNIKESKAQISSKKQLVEATIPSAFGNQIKQDLDDFEKYRVQIETPLEQIDSKPQSPGGKSYVSSLLGPTSYGAGSPVYKNRIYASPHQPHRFSINKFRQNVLKSRNAQSRYSGENSNTKSFDPVSPLLRPVNKTNRDLQMPVLNEQQSQGSSIVTRVNSRAHKELTKLNLLRGSVGVDQKPTSIKIDQSVLDQIENYQHHLIPPANYPKKLSTNFQKLDPLRFSLDTGMNQKQNKIFSNNLLKFYQNSQQQQNLNAHVQIKQATRNSFSLSQTDQLRMQKQSLAWDEMATFGEIKRSPRLQKDPNIMGHNNNSTNKSRKKQDQSLTSPKNAYQGYQNQRKMQRENQLLYKQQKLLKDIRENSQIQEHLVNEALKTNRNTFEKSNENSLQLHADHQVAQPMQQITGLFSS